MFDILMKQFHNLFDPSTSLGAFLISFIAGVVASYVGGFFVGGKYKESQIKKARIDVGEVNNIEQGIFKGRRHSSDIKNHRSYQKEYYSDYSINAGTVHGNIKQDVEE